MKKKRICRHPNLWVSICRKNNRFNNRKFLLILAYFYLYLLNIEYHSSNNSIVCYPIKLIFLEQRDYKLQKCNKNKSNR